MRSLNYRMFDTFMTSFMTTVSEEEEGQWDGREVKVAVG